MRLALVRRLSFCLMAVALATAVAAGSPDDGIPVAVVAPAGDGHFAWAAAEELARRVADRGGRLKVEAAPLNGSGDPSATLMIMPVRSLATQLPQFEVLELPFLFPSLGAVHANLDGALGARLTVLAAERGWQIVAFWDEGMHVISGLKRFDRVRNLKAREFLVTRPDPVAERQFAYWRADARRIDPESREAVLRECLIANRAATLQELLREQLYRVHLTLSLTEHRYEGWVVAAPAARWSQLDAATRQMLEVSLLAMRDWQRHDAQARETAALAALLAQGMTSQTVDEAERAAFRAALPDRVELMSDRLDRQQRRELVDLALAGTAAFVAVPAVPVAPPGEHAAPGAERH